MQSITQGITEAMIELLTQLFTQWLTQSFHPIRASLNSSLIPTIIEPDKYALKDSSNQSFNDFNNEPLK